jgi:hypothetical protein
MKWPPERQNHLRMRLRVPGKAEVSWASEAALCRAKHPGCRRHVQGDPNEELRLRTGVCTLRKTLHSLRLRLFSDLATQPDALF